MKRPEKEAVVAQLTEQFRNADAVYLTEYRGLTVPQVSELREKLGRDTSYTVAKNTLARIAAKEAGIEGLDDLLKGPTAITFVKGDFIEAAKTLRDFAKTNKALVISGGYADGPVRSCSPSSQATSRPRPPRPRTCSSLCLPRPCVRSTLCARSRKRQLDSHAACRMNHNRKTTHIRRTAIAEGRRQNERKPSWLSTPTKSCWKLSVK